MADPETPARERDSRITLDDIAVHEREDPHRYESGLSDVMLGGQDGLVNVLGIVLGVAAATGDVRVILAAGLAAAIGGNGLGVAGVSWTCKIMCLRFFDASGSGNSYDAAEALDYAVMMGAKVTNNSWGGGPL